MIGVQLPPDRRGWTVDGFATKSLTSPRRTIGAVGCSRPFQSMIGLYTVGVGRSAQQRPWIVVFDLIFSTRSAKMRDGA